LRKKRKPKFGLEERKGKEMETKRKCWLDWILDCCGFVLMVGFSTGDGATTSSAFITKSSPTNEPKISWITATNWKTGFVQ
jgi:hypothetical protein